MNVRPTKTFDLAPYGGEGQLTLAAPDFLRQYELEEAISMNCLQVNLDGKGKAIPKSGWLTIMQILVFIEKAPFELNVDAFLRYVKNLDTKNFGAGSAFVQDIQKDIATLKTEVSPFVKLGTQETSKQE